MQSNSSKPKVLFIDRDGVLINEAPPTYQIDSLSKLSFYPNVITYLGKIATELSYTLVMVTNQDGLGTNAYPLHTFEPIQQFIISTLQSEGIVFEAVFIDTTFAKDNAPTRKPGTAMLTKYLDKEAYDLENSFVIGDRITDMQLAENIGCKGIWLNNNHTLGQNEIANNNIDTLIKNTVALSTVHWQSIYQFLKLPPRIFSHKRITKETQIQIAINLDGSGEANISTGLPFFNHMLEQIARHANIDITIQAEGDLYIDEHHTIEDTAITLGEIFLQALGNKKGIERYGFTLPMDDCLATVAIDFGGRSWIVWEANFKREKIGDMPTEMFFHFFKSFSDGAKCNINIKADGVNEHHKIESIFKAFAKAIKMAIAIDISNNQLPTTKGVL
jgi:imidazoleglycerol-phosphate dehydratase / histidinol-phosphatase